MSNRFVIRHAQSWMPDGISIKRTEHHPFQFVTTSVLSNAALAHKKMLTVHVSVTMFS